MAKPVSRKILGGQGKRILIDYTKGKPIQREVPRSHIQQRALEENCICLHAGVQKYALIPPERLADFEHSIGEPLKLPHSAKVNFYISRTSFFIDDLDLRAYIRKTKFYERSSPIGRPLQCFYYCLGHPAIEEFLESQFGRVQYIFPEDILHIRRLLFTFPVFSRNGKTYYYYKPRYDNVLRMLRDSWSEVWARNFIIGNDLNRLKERAGEGVLENTRNEKGLVFIPGVHIYIPIPSASGIGVEDGPDGITGRFDVKGKTFWLEKIYEVKTAVENDYLKGKRVRHQLARTYNMLKNHGILLHWRGKSQRLKVQFYDREERNSTVVLVGAKPFQGKTQWGDPIHSLGWDISDLFPAMERMVQQSIRLRQTYSSL